MIGRWLAGFVLCVTMSVDVRAENPVTRLVDLVAARLEVIDEVARYKWNAGLQATDQAREADLLQSSLVLSAELGFDADFVRTVLEAQLAASRLVQETAFVRWQLTGQAAFPDTHDLAKDLRPRLDELTRQILLAAHEARGALTGCRARGLLVETPARVHDDAVWMLAVRGFAPAGVCIP